MPVLSHPCSEKVFCDIQREPSELQLVPIASAAVMGATGNSLSSLLSPFRYLYTLIKSSCTTYSCRKLDFKKKILVDNRLLVISHVIPARAKYYARTKGSLENVFL